MSAALRLGVRRARGFTLIELMVAIAILGILTGILVYNMQTPAKKVKTGSEANGMFAELHRAQEQYRVENPTYLSTGADDSALWPSAPSSTAQDATDPPDEWDNLHAKPGVGKLYCGYVTIAGTADDDIPSIATDFGMEQPDGVWYVLYARCDLDGGAVDAEYFSSSVDHSLQKRNEGH